MIKPYIVDIRNLDYTQLSQLRDKMKQQSPSGLLINADRSQVVVHYDGPDCSVHEFADVLGISIARITPCAELPLHGWQKF